jgi:hypothetical protein
MHKTMSLQLAEQRREEIETEEQQRRTWRG